MSEVEVAYVGLIGVIIGAIIGAGSSLTIYLLERKKTSKAQQFALIREKLEKAYSPLYFHFEHMKAWGERVKKERGIKDDKPYFAFSDKEIQRIMEDIYQILRANMHLISPTLSNLILQLRAYWYQDEATSLGQQMYNQLRQEYQSLVEQYNK